MGTELAGVSVVITRAADQQSDLAERLESFGAIVVSVSLVEIVAPEDGGAALRAELAQIETFDWVVVTSPNGARVVVGELDDRRPRVGFAAIGPGTASVLEAAGIEVALVPDRSVGEGLVDAFGVGTGARVLLAQAEAARPVVAEGLRAKGYDVVPIVAYRSVDAVVDVEQRKRATAGDVVLFTSSSMVERYVRLVGIDELPPAVGVIGPITAETAHVNQVPVSFMASEHTLDGLVEALVRWIDASRVGE